MILEVLRKPNEILSKIADPVDLDQFEALQSFFDDLIETWESLPGAQGLAAPQVGVSKQIFLYVDKLGVPRIVVNPKFLGRMGKVTSYGEGCLSVPDERFDVKRRKQVILIGYDRHGEAIRIKTKNKILAIVLQHEMDHLFGIMVDERGKKI